jgi:hypothetical protein
MSKQDTFVEVKISMVVLCEIIIIEVLQLIAVLEIVQLFNDCC